MERTGLRSIVSSVAAGALVVIALCVMVSSCSSGTSTAPHSSRWRALRLPNEVLGLAFTDSGHGTLIRFGEFGDGLDPKSRGVYITADGGRSWKLSRAPIVGHAAAGLPATVAALDDPVSIDSVGADLWLVYQGSHAQSGCHAGVLVSRDGGRTWRVSLRLPSATDLIDTSSFVGDRYGWVTVVNDRDPRPWRTAMLRTVDDGRTWQRVVPRAAAPVLPADWMEFVDARHGYLFNVVEDTQWRTSDGGASWRPSAPPDAGVDPSLCAVDAHESWLAIGDWPTESAPDLHGGALYSSTDAGITWQPSGRFSDVPLSDVWFVDRLHGWVAGEDPHGHAILYGTRDGGRHWRPQLDLGRRGRVYEFLDVGGRPNVWLYPDDTWNRAGDDYLYRLL